MPSLRKDRKSGNYFIDYRIGTQRKRVSLLTPDIKLARIRYRQQLSKLNTSDVFPIASIQEFFDEYKAHFHLTGRKSPSTIDVEKYVIEKFLRITTVKYLTDLTPKIIDDIFLTLTRNLAPETCNMYRRTLASIFERAVKWQLVDKNPIRTIDKITWQRDMPRVLSPKELKIIFEKSNTICPHLTQYFIFLLLTGVRRSEALNLTWNDVNYQDQLITLKHTKSRKPRYVLITPRIQHLLNLRSTLDKPFNFKQGYVSRYFHKIVKDAKIPKCKLHDLRKTFSTYIQQAGMPPNIVSQMLGHHTTDISRIYYTGTYSQMLNPIYSRFESDLENTLPMIAQTANMD